MSTTASAYPAAHRPMNFATSPAQQGTMYAHSAPLPTATGQIDPVWTQRKSSSSNRHALVVAGIIVGAVAMLVMLIYIMFSTGVAATTAGFLLAFVPLTIVLSGVIWLDRWEPEPRIMLILALLWGAGVSTASSLLVNSAAWLSVATRAGDTVLADQVGAVVVAPIVEESVKGLGVVLLFLIRRHSFDGPVDGVVYAATVAAGFAFTENILYFARSEGLIWAVFVVRGLMSPFAHLIFTACTGIAIGLAARSSNKAAVLIAFPLGLIPAMGLHALWNGSSVFADNFFILYLLVQVPIFIGVILLMVWLRRKESEVVSARLGEYAAAGWFAPQEVQMLASLKLRTQARQWSARFGERAKLAMKSFQRSATSLAFLRQRQLVGRAGLRAASSEAELLEKLQRDRQMFTVSAHGAIR
ncbi:MAG: PrsW family intramembrane metalloprotease [Beutenbergiaceae bacterium]